MTDTADDGLPNLPNEELSLIVRKAAYRMNQLGAARIPFIFLFDFELRAPVVVPLNDAARHGIFYRFHHTTNVEQQDAALHPRARSFEFSFHPPDRQRYAAGFAKVQEHLNRGDTYLVNLTTRVPITTTLTLAELFELTSAPYKLLLADRCVVFSPEPFVIIRHGEISTFPMKGTRIAHDAQSETQLMNDPKEIAEHATIVDLLRNDLSMVASEVLVRRFKYVERIPTERGELLQTSSEISGRLGPDYHKRIGNIICTLLPAGSISGAPKRATVRVIEEVEAEPRGYYTGVCGIFDGSDLESAVLIRFIESGPDGLAFRSGGGITSQSDCQAEYDEMLAKIALPISCMADSPESGPPRGDGPDFGVETTHGL